MYAIYIILYIYYNITISFLNSRPCTFVKSAEGHSPVKTICWHTAVPKQDAPRGGAGGSENQRKENIYVESAKGHISHMALCTTITRPHTQTTGSSVNNATRASTEVTISCATCWNTSNAIVNEQNQNQHHHHLRLQIKTFPCLSPV